MNGHNQISVLYGIQLYSIGSVLACLVTQSCLTLWTVALQAPLSMGFFRQEYWNGLPFPSTGYLPNPGIEPERYRTREVSNQSLLCLLHCRRILYPLSHQGFPYWEGEGNQ